MNYLRSILILAFMGATGDIPAMNNPVRPSYRVLSTAGGILQIVGGGVSFVFVKYGALLLKTENNVLIPFSEGVTFGIKVFTVIGGCVLMFRGALDILQPERWFRTPLEPVEPAAPAIHPPEAEDV